MYWNPEVLTRIDAADDLKIAPYHPDMNTTGTPTWIWEVKVDNRLSSEPIVVSVQNGIRLHCPSRQVRYWLSDRNSTYCSQNPRTLSLKVKLIRLT